MTSRDTEIERIAGLIEKAEKVVDDLCQGRIRWTMRVPAEPDHDPDLIISRALTEAKAALRRSQPASEPTTWAEPTSAPSLDVELDELLSDCRQAVKMGIGLAKSEKQPAEWRIRYLSTVRDDIDAYRAARLPEPADMSPTTPESR